jgi:hypothetical protein
MTETNEDTVRAEVRAWLEANWNPDYGLVEWRLKLAETGWGVPHWPSRWYGRDLPVGLVPVVEEEFKRIGAIGVQGWHPHPCRRDHSGARDRFAEGKVPAADPDWRRYLVPVVQRTEQRFRRCWCGDARRLPRQSMARQRADHGSQNFPFEIKSANF